MISMLMFRKQGQGESCSQSHCITFQGISCAFPFLMHATGTSKQRPLHRVGHESMAGVIAFIHRGFWSILPPSVHRQNTPLFL